jgi:hypothetical protein
MWEEVIRLNIVPYLRRLYEPSSGEICLDGADIRTLDPSWLRYITVIYLGHGVPQGYVWYPLLPRPRARCVYVGIGQSFFGEKINGKRRKMKDFDEIEIKRIKCVLIWEGIRHFAAYS